VDFRFLSRRRDRAAGGRGDAVPAGVPPEAAEAARDTLGGAVAAAGQLPDRLGAPLLDAAREAFVHGLHVTALISAVIAMSLAILVTVLLRHVRTGSESETPPGLDQRISDDATII
jgi:DHA2 family multidrug resistance protein-like MFS transporter